MPEAIIWGASGGIGQSIARLLADEFWTVVAVARETDSLTVITPYTIKAEFSSQREIHSAVEQARGISESYDLFIYTAGDIAAIRTPELKLDDWQRIMVANLTGAFMAARASLPILSPQAHLFFIGAIHERLRLPGLSAYAAAKAGLEAFAETLRKESRLNTTVIRPAAVATSFWEKVPFSMPANAIRPEQVAQELLMAYTNGKVGLLDIGINQ